LPTFLDNLGAIHRAQAECDAILLGRQERYLADLRSDEQTRQLLESSDPWASSDPYARYGSVAGLGSAPNDLYYPAALGRHSARPGSRQHGMLPPYYYTEMQHWLLVDAARTIEAMCPTAVCILDVLTQFAIFSGFAYSAVRKKKPGEKAGPVEEAEPTEAPDPGEPQEPVEPLIDLEIEAEQQRLDEWMEREDWHGWETELFRRTRRDGEAFLILDPADDLPHLRSVEPEQVKEPQDARRANNELGIGGGESWRFGILTSADDTAVPLGYWVVTQHNTASNVGQFYEPEEVFHLKTESVDRVAKRGVSDFFCNINDFPGVKKLLRALRESATIQADIAFIRQHPPGMMPTALGTSVPGGITTRQGDQIGAERWDGPHALDVPKGLEYLAGPMGLAGKNGALIDVLQAALRNIGARWQMPEGLVSGDASNANLASALVAEAPFVHAMETRQWFYRCNYKRFLQRVLWPDGSDEYEISVEMPPVVPRQAKEETERNATLNERGVMSTQTWCRREDLDFDDEQRLIAEHPIEPPSIMLGLDQGGEADDDTASENSTATNGGSEEK